MAQAKRRNLVQFVNAAGERKTIRVGSLDRRAADLVASHVHHLNNAAISGAPVPRETAVWMTGISAKLHGKLAKAGLVATREAAVPVELKAFLDGYIDKRTGTLKPATIANLKQARSWLAKFFGARRDLTTINRGEARDWHLHLKGKLAGPTVAMHVKKARQMFADAVERKMISENPFDKLKVGSMANESRQRFVLGDVILAVIGACPDAEWRLIFALARWGGLRVPTEVLALRWSDVDFERGRILVSSSKTEHHAGKATRTIPLFPELLPYLLEAHEQADDGAVHVIARHRNANHRTRAEKIVRRAGVQSWPKLFQNLRSTRETELADAFPIKVVCAWMGNTEAVAKRHYLQVTEDHFAAALKGDGKSAAKSAAVSAGQHRTLPDHQTQNPSENRGICEIAVPPRGVEPSPVFLRKLHIRPRALRKALQSELGRLQKQAPRIRRRLIDNLTRHVRAAQRRAGGGLCGR
jgi:integrase